MINRKLRAASKTEKRIAIHLNIYSRNNIEEQRDLEIHVMLFMILVMRRLSVSATKFARIDPSIKIYIEI